MFSSPPFFGGVKNRLSLKAKGHVKPYPDTVCPKLEGAGSSHQCQVGGPPHTAALRKIQARAQHTLGCKLFAVLVGLFCQTKIATTSTSNDMAESPSRAKGGEVLASTGATRKHTVGAIQQPVALYRKFYNDIYKHWRVRCAFGCASASRHRSATKNRTPPKP